MKNKKFHMDTVNEFQEFAKSEDLELINSNLKLFLLTEILRAQRTTIERLDEIIYHINKP